MRAVQLIECPRDAMQGWKRPIDTDAKVAYINALLQVGFDTVDFGSFVSPKAIPQMADTKAVVQRLDLTGSTSKLLAIVANSRGAEEAVAYEQIACLGFPFSLSPTFQARNANSTLEESLGRVDAIQNLCVQHNRQLVVYLSMGFGNPYGDAYDEGVLMKWTDEMLARGVGVVSLADTVGVATPEQISFALRTLIPRHPNTIFGVHLHSAPGNWKAKVAAAYEAGCRRFDGALKGIGGCPMAGDELVGNMASEWLMAYLSEQGALPSLNPQALQRCMALANEIFV